MTRSAVPVIPIYISKRQAATVLGVSLPTLEARIRTGDLPAYRLGPRSVRLKLSDVEALLSPVPVTRPATAASSASVAS